MRGAQGYMVAASYQGALVAATPEKSCLRWYPFKFSHKKKEHAMYVRDRVPSRTGVKLLAS